MTSFLAENWPHFMSDEAMDEAAEAAAAISDAGRCVCLCVWGGMCGCAGVATLWPTEIVVGVQGVRLSRGSRQRQGGSEHACVSSPTCGSSAGFSSLNTHPHSPSPIHPHTTHTLHTGYMCCYRNASAPSVAFWDEGDPNAASITSAAAGSVAARGLLWANR